MLDLFGRKRAEEIRTAASEASGTLSASRIEEIRSQYGKRAAWGLRAASMNELIQRAVRDGLVSDLPTDASDRTEAQELGGRYHAENPRSILEVGRQIESIRVLRSIVNMPADEAGQQAVWADLSKLYQGFAGNTEAIKLLGTPTFRVGPDDYRSMRRNLIERGVSLETLLTDYLSNAWHVYNRSVPDAQKNLLNAKQLDMAHVPVLTHGEIAELRLEGGYLMSTYDTGRTGPSDFTRLISALDRINTREDRYALRQAALEEKAPWPSGKLDEILSGSRGV